MRRHCNLTMYWTSSSAGGVILRHPAPEPSRSVFLNYWPLHQPCCTISTSFEGIIFYFPFQVQPAVDVASLYRNVGRDRRPPQYRILAECCESHRFGFRFDALPVSNCTEHSVHFTQWCSWYSIKLAGKLSSKQWRKHGTQNMLSLPSSSVKAPRLLSSLRIDRTSSHWIKLSNYFISQ